ncbi:unnamed protein product [Linum trigynum]|uniref:Reverse transcriptase domain-containing protein n=1 Tax=Linum trigynum TaxID=586398 RepID=A0AAV2FXQ3_9ROSI
MIRSLINEDGQRVTDTDGMAGIAERFYRELLGKCDPEVAPPEVDKIKSILLKRLLLEQSDELCSPVTAEEVKATLFGFDGEKAPGPDGFPACFFKVAWNVIGGEVTAAILYCFRVSEIPISVNATLLALIPKIRSPEEMKFRRPISCCNILYKCMAKILAVRLSSVMPCIISESQTAFVKGRIIGENILLAHELVQKYGRKNISPRSLVKVDLMKAFDSVDWGFLFNTLQAMGIPDRFLQWLRMCVTTPKLSIGFNGGSVGYFSARKGLRQGDPLSPYLFAVAMEILSCLMNEAVKKNEMPFHPMCKRLGLTHLMFADDLLLFSDGSNYGIQCIKKVLAEFRIISGLKSNPAKCELYCGGISVDWQEAMENNSGYKLGVLPVRYFGLPLLPGKLTIKACTPLIDRVTGRISSWKAKALSYAGKFQLVMSVLYSLTQFWMSIFILPKSVIRAIEKLCCDFLWGVGDGSRKRAVVAWPRVTYPKKEGGLGFRDMVSWNLACVTRHIWAILLKQGVIVGGLGLGV